MRRYELINEYIKLYNFKSFLEIGHYKGEAFNNVIIESKETVDPDVSCHATYVMTSDEFFAQNKKKYDIIFIDGLHKRDFVDRDINNGLKCLNKGGVIIMHDCHPTSERIQQNEQLHNEAWMGDCWKAFVKNRALLPYEMYVCDDDCGCGVIDTNKQKTTDTSLFPTDMEKMTYQEFVKHPEWMSFKTTIQV